MRYTAERGTLTSPPKRVRDRSTESSDPMAIEDRDYARRSPTSGAGPLSLLTFNSWLIIVNSAVFLLEVR